MPTVPMPAKPTTGQPWLAVGNAWYDNVQQLIVDVPALKADVQQLQAAISQLQATKAPLASPTFTGTVSGVTKAMVGLGNVDNVAVASMTIAASQLTGTIDPARLPSGSTLAYNPTAAQISGMDAGTLYVTGP